VKTKMIAIVVFAFLLTSKMQANAGESVPANMALIPAGLFQMGDTFNEGLSSERPVHSIYLTAFYMDKYEVSNEKMREVMQWAYDNGKVTATNSTVQNTEGSQQELLDLDDSSCQLSFTGGTFSVDRGKGNYPCVQVTWYGAVAYCNYRSQKEELSPCYDLSDWSCNWSANGYRLPTEAEWEKAARGGKAGKRFPWGDEINHDVANYQANGRLLKYDTSPYANYTYHPDYDDGGHPYWDQSNARSQNLRPHE